MLLKIIAVSALSLFMAVLIVALIKARALNKKTLAQPVPPTSFPPFLVKDVSGDNRWETELDLAQAYVELHQHQKAKPLLQSVITYGDVKQISQARKIFAQLLKYERTL